MRRIALVALLALPAGSLSAQPVQRITFSEYASPFTTEYQATVGRPVVSGGFQFVAYRSTGARNALGTWGTDLNQDEGALNQPTNRGNSVAMFGTTNAEVIDMLVAGEFPLAPTRQFDVFSIDVGHMFSSDYIVGGSALEPFQLTFSGWTTPTGTAQLSQTFTIPVPASGDPFLNTLMFSNAWRGIYRLSWSQSNVSTSQFHQFTNIQAQVIPEPSTYVLLGTGLIVLYGVTRRRRTAV
jgi:hypothetical protein